jgi:Conserved protein/domain typically associated with flavoprotein oxygenases, DIM6/NTAB family
MHEGNEASFRHVLGHFATGVTAVTTFTEDGKVVGLTANAFCSLSLHPPLVLVCVSYKSVAYRPLRDTDSFAVHILTDQQIEVAHAFAREVHDKTELVEWDLSARGNPVLKHYLGLLECRLVQEYTGGDHAILIGEVASIDVKPEGRPLLYYRGELRAQPGIDKPFGINPP